MPLLGASLIQPAALPAIHINFGVTLRIANRQTFPQAPMTLALSLTLIDMISDIAYVVEHSNCDGLAVSTVAGIFN